MKSCTAHSGIFPVFHYNAWNIQCISFLYKTSVVIIRSFWNYSVGTSTDSVQDKKHFVHVQAIKYAKKAIGFLWCNRNDKNASGNPYFTTCLNMILPMLLYNVSCHTHMWRFCVTRKQKTDRTKAAYLSLAMPLLFKQMFLNLFIWKEPFVAFRLLLEHNAHDIRICSIPKGHFPILCRERNGNDW